MRPPAKPAGGGSTAAVLWLMILLVFLPIGAAHGVARFAQAIEASHHGQ